MRRRGEQGGKAGEAGKVWHGGSPRVGGSWETRKREGTKGGQRSPRGREDSPGRRQQVFPFSPEIPFPLGQLSPEPFSQCPSVLQGEDSPELSRPLPTI